MNEYNYRYVTESILPRTNPQVLIDSFVKRYEDPNWKLLLDSKFSRTEQMQMMQALLQTKVFSGMRFKRESRIWNSYCFANWTRSTFMESEIDKYGRVKYKDMGYEPPEADECYWDSHEPQYTDDITDNL